MTAPGPPAVAPVEVYARRRRSLARRLGGGVAVVTSAPVAQLSGDVNHVFRQDSCFYYLTGLEEPAAALILVPGGHPFFTLLVRPRDAEREVWDGVRLGPEASARQCRADAAGCIEDLEKILGERAIGATVVHHLPGANPEVDQRLGGVLARLARRRPACLSQDLAPVLAEMRLRKEAAELGFMRCAAAITGYAHAAAMGVVAPGRREYEVQAALEFEFRRRGAAGPGYPSIVGSGPHACVLHHTAGDRHLRAGELVLIDAGCEFGLYNADVTRTLPVSGRFSHSQRDIYDLVLEAQTQALKAVRPGAPFGAPDRAAVGVLCQGLADLGILPGSAADIRESGAYRRFYMHRTSHWLGLDVHDPGWTQRQGRWRRLASGMVLTVEPGLYLPATDGSVPERYRGMGVRIEDDVAVIPGGSEVLTASIPRQPAAVERAMARRRARRT